MNAILANKPKLPTQVKVDGTTYRVQRQTWSQSRGHELYLLNDQGQPFRTCPHVRYWEKGMIFKSSGCRVEYL